MKNQEMSESDLEVLYKLKKSAKSDDNFSIEEGGEV